MAEFSLQDAMQHFLKSSRLKNGIRAVRIEEIWESIMGKTVAKYTDKLQITGDTLFISTQVAALKNELLYQREQIIKRVNEELGEKAISKIVIR